jgi:hypothetical protein
MEGARSGSLFFIKNLSQIIFTGCCHKPPLPVPAPVHGAGGEAVVTNSRYKYQISTVPVPGRYNAPEAGCLNTGIPGKCYSEHKNNGTCSMYIIPNFGYRYVFSSGTANPNSNKARAQNTAPLLHPP